MTNHETFNDISPLYAKKHAKANCVFIDAWGKWKKDEWDAAGLDLIIFGDGNSG